MNPEILIIGGGVIGLSIARELHKRGVGRITLVDKGVCGEESSWAAGGMLGPQAEANEGGAFFDLCSASRDLFPALAAELLDETGIDIELDCGGTLYLAFTDEDVTEVHKRFRWQRQAGLAVEHLSSEAVRRTEPYISPDVRGALFFPNDWQVDNRNLVTALKRYLENAGIGIRENTCVDSLIVEGGMVIGARTAAGNIFADRTVLATGAWTSLIKLGLADFTVKVEPVCGQIICFRSRPGLFKHVVYSRRGYIVPRADGRILAGSTTENVGFEKAVTDAARAGLRKMAEEISPFLGTLPVVDSWCGLRPFAADGMPVIGEIAGLFLASGHYRNGILLAPLTAKLAAANMIDGEDSEFFKPFTPGRLSVCVAAGV